MSRTGRENDIAQRYTTVVHKPSVEFDAEVELSTRVLTALDSLPGFDMENSETVIFDHIDLDALDELFNSDRESEEYGRVTFQLEQFLVTATATGDVIIEEPAE